MMPAHALFFVFLIGVVAGLRSMTAPAVVCWGAYEGWLTLQGTALSFFAHSITLILLTVGALAELIADKLPFVPKRTTPGPLFFRLITGATCGAALCADAGTPLLYGVLLGAFGAVVGAFGGYYYRSVASGMSFLAALLEDAVAVFGGFWIVSRF
jgi:uncharacterized membrane protein